MLAPEKEKTRYVRDTGMDVGPERWDRSLPGDLKGGPALFNLLRIALTCEAPRRARE
jgi:hypothetical protein